MVSDKVVPFVCIICTSRINDAAPMDVGSSMRNASFFEALFLKKTGFRISEEAVAKLSSSSLHRKDKTATFWFDIFTNLTPLVRYVGQMFRSLYRHVLTCKRI